MLAGYMRASKADGSQVMHLQYGFLRAFSIDA
jgi:hypothetical protein